MLDKLKEYKELIGIVVFFLGGFIWLRKEFPTRQDLTSQDVAIQARLEHFECLLRTYMELTQLQAQNSRLVSEIAPLEKIRASMNDGDHANPPLPSALQDEFKGMMRSLDEKTATLKENATQMQKLGKELELDTCGKKV